MRSGVNWTVVDFALSTFVAKDSTSINILHRAFFYIPERLAHERIIGSTLHSQDRDAWLLGRIIILTAKRVHTNNSGDEAMLPILNLVIAWIFFLLTLMMIEGTHLAARPTAPSAKV
jgi:hypothetical protein